jgi:hypothetical protein
MITDDFIVGEEITIDAAKLESIVEKKAVFDWAAAHGYKVYYMRRFVNTFAIDMSSGMYVLQPSKDVVK